MGLIRGVSGVRGIVGRDITEETAALYGRAFGATVRGAVAVGRDSRRGGDRLAAAVRRGVRESGSGAIDLGVVPTPTVGVATRLRGFAGGIAVTASHNPEEWNGFKFFSPRGVFLTREEVERVFDLADGGGGAVRSDGPAESAWSGAADEHVRLVASCPFVDRDAIARMRPRVALDCVNAAGSVVLPGLLRDLGCDVVELSCAAGEPFSRGAEPVPEHLAALSEAVVRERAAAGLACDPDADRLAIVDERGRPVGEEYTLALAADVVLTARPGPVVANVSTSLMIEDVARAHGAPLWRTAVGEINVVARMLEVNAVVGGEGNGGVIVPSVHPGRDAATAAALVMTALARPGAGPASAVVARFPTYSMVKRKVAAAVPSQQALTESMAAAFSGATPDLTDGVKMCWPGRWVHVRMSGTEPVVRVIAEAGSPADARSLADAAEGVVSRMSEGTRPCAASSRS
ncbi:MAG: phosphoglucosamine mutase [Candidatus Eisenbacteria bacterium]|nr:phosphoglucosamine mutase [Candidatus Eisenbacteria bacterium]